MSHKYITAVGKVEWSKLRWEGGGVATKKHIINGTDIVFTAAKNVEDAQRSKQHLATQEVNSRLFDCSDAHDWSDSNQHERIGHSFSWVKADTTFEGLRLAVLNYENRVYIGHEPEKTSLVKKNRTKYIRSLKIRKKDSSNLEEHWFEAEIPFNHDLIVIIGNKGNAKSALTDILALCGNTRIQDFSFLNKVKFCDKQKKASHFEAEVVWESGLRKVSCLSSSTDVLDVELVRYVPQSFFERVTNEVSASVGGGFDKELKKVIFSHISGSDKLEKESLDDLLDHHSNLINTSLRTLRGEMHLLNPEISDLEYKTSEDQINQLATKLETQRRLLSSHEETKPQPFEQPKEQLVQAQNVESLRVESKRISEAIEREENKLSKLKKKRSEVAQVIGMITQQFEKIKSYKASLSNDLHKIDQSLNVDNILSVSIDVSQVEEIREKIDVELEISRKALDTETEESLVNQLKKKNKLAVALQEELTLADKNYQRYLNFQQQWENRKKDIIGSVKNVGSIIFLESKLKEQKDVLPEQLNELIRKRRKLVQKIYEQLAELTDIYRRLSKPVQESIDKHSLTQEKYGLDFRVKLVPREFKERFLEFISQGRAGSFSGREEGRTRLEEICSQYDFNTFEDAIDFTENLISALREDRRYDPCRKVDLKNQIKRGTVSELYDFIFSLDYLGPEYSLQLDGKEMNQLSPGERGVLLLIFYLLIDKDDCPLLIDQPEENLDNQSIYNLLVPAIKEAKKRRQIFLVTHNPNLAIVCDAAQIIHSNIDKNDGNRVTYKTGAIENPIFNKFALDILEGTRPAFEVRRGTYLTLSER